MEQNVVRKAVLSTYIHGKIVVVVGFVRYFVRYYALYVTE